MTEMNIIDLINSKVLPTHMILAVKIKDEGWDIILAWRHKDGYYIDGPVSDFTFKEFDPKEYEEIKVLEIN